MAIGFPVKDDYVTGDVLTAANMNDLSGSVNLLESAQYAAGKNKIINGDFGIWQRGTSISATNTYAYISDRWQSLSDGAITGARTAFTPGTAPVAGYEGAYHLRYTKTSGTYWQIQQYIEEVQTLAGQTATISFWAKVDSAKTIFVQLSQNFGSGGSATVTTSAGTQALTTSWARYSFTVAVPSISGKTVGTSSNLALEIGIGATTGNITFDIWGVQVEAGSTASDFQTATGTLQGELAACQRYFYQVPDGLNETIGMAFYLSATELDLILQLPVQMRTTPTLTQTSGTDYFKFTRNGGTDNFNSFTLAGESTTATIWAYNNSQASGTAGQAGLIQFNNALAKLALSAEL
jgi:hypothetical protein